MCDCGTLNEPQVENKEACERSKDDFLTVYKKEFIEKSSARSEQVFRESEYPDIIAGPFTEYVLPNSKDAPPHPYEDVNSYYTQLVSTDKKLIRYLDKEPDSEVIANDLNNRTRTVYQVDFCDFKDGFESKKSRDRKQVSLPPDWGEVPVTTQRASFRLPGRIATWDLTPKAIPPPPSVLRPNVKEREILQVTTGESEYESRIGALGNLVMEDKLHGLHEDGVECKKYAQMLSASENRNSNNAS